jgi:hypothetical protein
MASSELRQPQRGGEQAMDLTSDPFLQNGSAGNPAAFGTVVTKIHYFVPRTHKHNYSIMPYLIIYRNISVLAATSILQQQQQQQ